MPLLGSLMRDYFEEAGTRPMPATAQDLQRPDQSMAGAPEPFRRLVQPTANYGETPQPAEVGTRGRLRPRRAQPSPQDPLAVEAANAQLMTARPTVNLSPRAPEAAPQYDFDAYEGRPLAARSQEDLVRTQPRSAQDVVREQMENMSPSYARYNQMPNQDEYIAEHKPQGFLGRLGAAMKLGGKMLVASGLNPVYGLEGVAIGALDKNAPARYDYATQVDPRRRALLSQAGAEIGLNEQVQNQNAREEQMRQNAELHRSQ